MEERRIPHTVILENKNQLSITQVEDVDTFDESRIVLFTAEDTIIVEGYDLHIKKLDVSGGELSITGEVTSLVYENRDGYGHKGKGFFKKILK